MSRVIKCRGVNGDGYDVWINPDLIIAYSAHHKDKTKTVLWIGGGEEDFITVEGSVENTLTAFGFNNGGA